MHTFAPGWIYGDGAIQVDFDVRERVNPLLEVIIGIDDRFDWSCFVTRTVQFRDHATGTRCTRTMNCSRDNVYRLVGLRDPILFRPVDLDTIDLLPPIQAIEHVVRQVKTSCVIA